MFLSTRLWVVTLDVVEITVVVEGLEVGAIVGVAAPVGAAVVVVEVLIVVGRMVDGVRGGRRVAKTKASEEAIAERGREHRLSM